MELTKKEYQIIQNVLSGTSTKNLEIAKVLIALVEKIDKIIKEIK